MSSDFMQGSIVLLALFASQASTQSANNMQDHDSNKGELQ